MGVSWEIFENTKFVIHQFRSSGPNSADYAGDSGLNSCGDILCCMLGYVAMECIRVRSFKKCGNKLAVIVGAVYVVVMTIILYYWICDNLIIMWINIIKPNTIVCRPS